MNYFNYFTEIEEHFQRARGTATFLLSPLDWALIETWKDAGVPLAAVRKGIDRAFEKWRARKRRVRTVNSLAYCTQEVLDAARQLSEEVDGAGSTEVEQSFPHQELRDYFLRNASLIKQAQAQRKPENSELYHRTSQALEELAAASDEELSDTEAIEQRLAVSEGKLIAAAMQEASEEAMLSARREMDRQLAPHRHKMTADQLARLERQYLERECLQAAGLPRLSLFYL